MQEETTHETPETQAEENQESQVENSETSQEQAGTQEGVDPGHAENTVEAVEQETTVEEKEAETEENASEEAAPTEEAQVEEPEKEAAPVAEAAESEVEAKEETSEEEVSSEEVSVEEGEGEGSKLVTADDDQKQKQSLIEEILADEEHFKENLEKGTPAELVLLLEGIADYEGNFGPLISKVKAIKNDYQAKTTGEGAVEDKATAGRFSTVMARLNKKRSEYFEKLEVEKEENSQIKYEILEELKEIVEKEQVAEIAKVRDIQARWKATGWVLQKDIAPLNNTYRHYMDQYYKLRSLYNDLRDMDRKYNLEEKQKILAAIEELIPADAPEDREVWNKLSGEVKELQNTWKDIGHVPRENVDEINSSYRSLLDQFYEMRGRYYEEQDQMREENGEKKKALIEKLKPFANFTSQKAREWNSATKAVLAVQAEWKKTGPAPSEINSALWKEYRSLCDGFFNRKGTFFKDFDQVRSENLKKKQEICEQAEALQESEDFKETAEKLKELQKEWKKIGPVHDRHSNKVWKRFRKACDHFFNRRSENKGGKNQGEVDNLKTKEALIEELKGLLTGSKGGKKDELLSTFKDIQERWKATGHVPYKEKDRINGEFRDNASAFFKKLNLKEGEISRLRMEARINQIDDEDERSRRIKSEMHRLRKKMGSSRETIESYETNILYIAKGKKGDSLRKMINGQIEGEKQKLAEMEKKYKSLQHLLDNPPEAEEETQEEATEVPAASGAQASTEASSEEE